MAVEIAYNIPERIETRARSAYERCHRDDTFADLKRRARFSKEDRGLLRDWVECVAEMDDRKTCGRSDRLRSNLVGA
ncbi:hypothetical protein EET67_24755 [Pseudaminobacter arsenicus]|uniref:Uncharacterized protein n=1 Tax=Borborobacter arsenicus TaxID=1851146 RepID=A0A432UZ43_9HYPH|nr:hypothetical protein EET67_24755 [Pseudaminobacter arsenicus]